MARAGFKLVVVGLVAAVVVLHLFISVFNTNSRAGLVTSKEKAQSFLPHLDSVFDSEPVVELEDIPWSPPPLANATFFMLARNAEADGAVNTIHELEERFNKRHGYPYVFLNEEVFSDEFKSKIREAISPHSTVEFGQIPEEHWSLPPWINKADSDRTLQSMGKAGVKYGDSISYRHMCRFNSGFFYKHPLMQKYRWYWRLEPNVKYHCNIWNDPFKIMEVQKKTYGFTIAAYEIRETVRTLWGEVKSFMDKYPEHIAQDNAIRFITNTQARSYNRCHFWSNFEIADMDFWRSEAYAAFFDHLDQAGGIFYERWGDAPIHSIAASILLPRSKIHFFEEIGYQHDSWSHCPVTREYHKQGQCDCDAGQSFDYKAGSCLKMWDRVNKL